MIYCYANSAKSNSIAMCSRFAHGARAAGEQAEVVSPKKLYLDGPAVFYGMQKELLGLWQEVRQRGLPFYYIDNGYFNSKWKGGDHYRVTKNALQHSGGGSSTCQRLRDLGITFKPWRVAPHNAKPLIALQSHWWYEFNGTTLDDWLTGVLASMKACGWPEPQVRSKDDAKLPLNWDVVSAVVTHSSNTAVDGMIQGIPAVCTHPCAGGYADNRFADWPQLKWPGDRMRWAGVLADNQWTLAEIESGLAWRMLNR